MMMRSFFLLLTVAAALFLTPIACQSPPALSEETAPTSTFPIATADHDYVLTADQYYSSLNKSDVQLAGGYLTRAAIEAFRDSIVVDTLLGFEADQLDLRKYYYDFWDYRLQYQSLLIQAYLEKNVYSKVAVDSSEVPEFHKNRADLFSSADEVKLFQILVLPTVLRDGRDSLHYRSLGKEEFEAQVRDYAFTLYDLIRMGEPFQNVAFQYSHDIDSKDKGGFVGWIPSGRYHPPFDSVAFNLKAGEYSQPYRDRDGWHILYIDDRVYAGLQPLSRPDVYTSVLHSLKTVKSNQIGRQLLDSLRASLVVDMNEAIMDADIYVADDSLWAAIVNSGDTIDCKFVKNYEEDYRRVYGVPSTTRAIKEIMLRNIAERFMIADAARAERLDTTAVNREKEYSMRHRACRSILERTRHTVDWAPGDSAVRRYYDDHLDEFVKARPLTIQRVVCSDSVYGEFLRDQVMSGIDLEVLAKTPPEGVKVSLQYKGAAQVGPGDFPQELYSAALGLGIGDISHPIRDGKSFSVMKCLGRSDAQDFEHARTQITTRLALQHRAEELLAHRDRLFGKYHVHFPRQLKSVHLKPFIDRNN